MDNTERARMFFIYDVCIHGDGDYREQPSVEFENPIHVGDFITSGDGGAEYLVFSVIHSGFGAGSAVHARPSK